MFGVIAIFDEKTERLIKEIWHELRERNISSYAFEVEDRKPHITIATYRDVNNKEFFKRMDDVYEGTQAVDITFESIGSFLNSGALYFAPTVTRKLNDLHVSHHRHFVQFNDIPDSLYLPNYWIPHCTIANRLSSENLTKAFEYCTNCYSKIEGRIDKIAVIDVTEKGKAPIIYCKKLV
ncbi:2'-5' RNA ligase family protein [Bacillus salitolerans]|uniref:2'-5' RNA ligase family protein n=1 Tax=Bacillus salitolerans TaxID=1437434 RepID=A0ABW4LTD8_9BACI